MMSSRVSANPSNLAPSGGDGVSDYDRNKWDKGCQKINDMEKIILALQAELKRYEDAKVLTNLSSVMIQIQQCPTKADLDKIMNEIAKLREDVKYCQEDLKGLRELIDETNNNLD